MFDAYLGTSTGVHRLSAGALEPLGLEAERVSAIHAWRDGGATAVLAGTYGNGLYRRAGRDWEHVDAGMTAPALRCIAPDRTHPGSLLAGTEPARVFRSGDGGAWHELGGVTAIEGHERWFLPYSPRAGAVRNVYSPPGSTRRLLAAVEVGGLLTSDDGGETWSLAPVIEDEDIHFVTGHPERADLLYAALGTASLTRGGDRSRLGGVARSTDGGATWEKLETDYTRAVLVPPARPDLLLAGPAARVGRGGRIVVSADGGDSWEPAGAGLAVPMPDMVELFVAAPDGDVWAICSRGRLLRATPGEWSWSSALPDGSELAVEAVAFVPA